MVKTLPNKIALRIMKHHVAIGKELKANNSFLGSVGLPGNASIDISQDKVSIVTKSESGIYTYWFASVGFPNKIHLWRCERVSHAESESEGIRGGVVKAKLERVVINAYETIICPIFYRVHPEKCVDGDLKSGRRRDRSLSNQGKD
jgi:hypothetical protein